MSFRPNSKVRAAVARQPEHQAMIRENAERVMLEAEHAAPIGETGDYIDRFRLTIYPTFARVGNDDFAAHIVEWGSVNNPPYAPLRRGVTAAGLRLDEDAKGE